MATISSSQKLANTQPPTLSATQESSAEGEGLFASLFGGVVLEDASETKSADMADEASRPASGDGDAEREDVAGIIIAEDGDASEAEDDVSTTLLAGIGATAIVTHTADDSTKDSMPQDGTAEKDAQRQSPTPSLLSEAQRDGRIVAKQLEMAARTARQPANQDDSARSKQPAMQLAGQMTGKSGKTTAMQSGNQLQQTVIGAERQASKIAGQNAKNARILPETGKLAEYAGTNIKMAKKDSHIAAMADAKTDTAQSAKQLSETLSAADLKTARQSAMTAEQMSRIALKPISGEGLDTAPKTASPETASAQLMAANTSASGGQSSNQGTQGQAQQTLAGSSMSDTIADMLDMMEDNWAETLVKRIERALGQKAEGIDFELNPRSLGRLRVNLSLVNDQTHIHMKAESASAAQMIGDAEHRLAQMLEQSGMKLAQFSSQSGLAGDQHANDQSQKQGEQHKQLAEGDVAGI
ncbi:MAG: flagellar hook-length control protein FliK, partial [Candidatus Puniceispirillaceae bacterium]